MRVFFVEVTSDEGPPHFFFLIFIYHSGPNKRHDKLGLSCAKLRASLSFFVKNEDDPKNEDDIKN